ncbi:MAG: hypothetical protein V3U54_07390 [Thermodesulfobacteriota bacterium]
MIYIDSEISALLARPNGVAGRAGRGGTERDAETEGPEFSSGSIQHDRKRRAQRRCFLAESKMRGKNDIFGHLSLPQQILIIKKVFCDNFT